MERRRNGGREKGVSEGWGGGGEVEEKGGRKE